jgi:hypothetical protein
VHRRKTTLVVMRVPQRKLLAASAAQMSSMSHLQLARLHVVPN